MARSKEVRQARRELHQALQEDIRKQVQAIGDSNKSDMEAGKVREALTHISRWYKQARGAHAPSTTDDIDKVTAERAEIYRCRPPDVLKVPLLVQKEDIKDIIPTEAEVMEAV